LNCIISQPSCFNFLTMNPFWKDVVWEIALKVVHYSPTYPPRTRFSHLQASPLTLYCWKIPFTDIRLCQKCEHPGLGLPEPAPD
jgi:hypothetical protein